MYEIRVLQNGVQIVLHKMPYVRSIAFGIWVKNGSRNEDAEKSGISHFIEHMLFKGTTNRSAKDIADQMDAIGGQLNAYTSKEYTCYYARTLDSHFDISLDILSDMFFNSKFEEQEIKKESTVILEEINMYEDTPEELVHDILQYNIWGNDMLGASILGTKETVSSFDRDTFIKYYDKHYHPKNTVVALAGNFDIDVIVEKIEKHFGNFERKSEAVNAVFNTIYKPTIAVKPKEIEQVHLAMGFPSIKIGSEQSYSLAVLNTIFGGGMSSRLFQKIREEHGLAYAVYSYNSSYTDTGLFTIYAALNSQCIEQLINLLMQEIKLFETDKITDEQLKNTKEQLKSNYILSLESSASIMNSIGKSQTMLKKIVSPDELIEKIDSVTLESVYELSRKIFDFEKISLAAVGNVGNFDFQGLIKNAR